MPSVFSLLLDTLPFTVATRAAARPAGVAVDQLSAQQLWPYLRPLPRTADHTAPAPPAPPPPPPVVQPGPSLPMVTGPAVPIVNLGSNPGNERLWSWQHTAATPHRISNVNARVRDTGYKNHVVFDSIEFGAQEMAGPFATGSRPFEDHIEIHDHNGRPVNLPLTQAYLHSKWLITGGWMPQNSHWLWPLETYVDQSIVLAFTYELTVMDATDEANALHPQSIRAYSPPATDPGEQELQNFSQRGAAPGWVLRARRGEFFVRDATVPGAQQSGSPLFGPSSPVISTGGSMTLLSGFPRILVVVALTTCRERNNFEPGGIVGMGRLYPHVMLIADVPIKLARTSIRLTRPQSTRVLDQGNGTVPGTCCHAHPPMASVLVTDSNESPGPGRLAFLPFWSGAFAYYEVDPHIRLGDWAMAVVRRDRPQQRTIPDAGVRVIPNMGTTITSVLKAPRQGQWDNVHIAPRLQLPAARVRFGSLDFPITASRWHLDPVVMAPFCSHDCFHLHWRWSMADNEQWVLGWGNAVPHQDPGRPMVPRNQDVHIETPAANVFTYHAWAHPTSDPMEDHSRHIEAGQWQVFMHHGGAYAQGIVSWRQSAARRVMAAMSTVRTGFGGPVEFLDASGQRIDYVNEPAALYWNLRYFVEGQGATESGYIVRDWLTVDTDDVDRARRG